MPRRTPIDVLERHFGRLAIPNLASLMVASQTISWLLSLLAQGGMLRINVVALLELRLNLVLQGEVWRLVTFPLCPPSEHWLWGLFALYIFYLFGTALEAKWGHFRFNVYVLLGALSTLAISVLAPTSGYGVGIIDTSLFLAFAYLFPDFELLIMFILPVKIKYLAMITWFGLVFALLFMPWSIKLFALATAASFLIFFGKDVYLTMKYRQRRMSGAAKKLREGPRVLHRCAVCGATEQTHPDEEFRVCSTCSNGEEYCSRHVRNHEHR